MDLSRTLESIAICLQDADILGGTPVLRDTRIPVYDVAASVAAGLPTDRIVAAYPGITAEAVELAAFLCRS